MKTLLLLLLVSNFAHALDLRVMTWNVYMLPKPIKFSEQGVRMEAQAEALKAMSADLDVIVLNEAFMAEARQKVSEALKPTFPYAIHLVGAGPFYKVMDSGVMILSRYPMHTLGETTFKECAGADCFASKGALLVEVALPEQKKLQLMATHMQAGGELSNAKIRSSQLDEMKALFVQHAQGSVPQLLLGDLNVDERQPEFAAALAQLQMQSATISGDLQSAKALTTSCLGVEDPKTPTQWLDHVFYRTPTPIPAPAKKAIRLFYQSDKTECDLSDHLPVLSTVSLP